jgi:hypothetical protein
MSNYEPGEKYLISQNDGGGISPGKVLPAPLEGTYRGMKHVFQLTDGSMFTIDDMDRHEGLRISKAGGRRTRRSRARKSRTRKYY